MKNTFKKKINIRIFKNRLLEFIRFDSRIASLFLLLVYLIEFCFRTIKNNEIRALIAAGKIFRHIRFPFARNIAAKILYKSIEKNGSKKIGQKILSFVEKEINTEAKKRIKNSIIFFDKHPFDGRLLILSYPVEGKKGVILIKFTDYFKYVFKIFDIKKLAKDYILIVEPSYSGYYDEDILCLMAEDIPIIIQTPEPVDFNFIQSLSGNFYPIDIGANCWVSKTIFHPIANTEIIYDVIMVAIWADFKRHYHLFKSLKKCGQRLKIALVGKPWPREIEEIKDEAKYYNVFSQIDFYENLSQQEINILLNQSKVSLLLSKKEGINKSIIEAMYANTPGFYLEGFNYGYKYHYVTPETGGFISPNKLPEFLDRLKKQKKATNLATSRTIQSYISPEISIKKIIKLLKKIEDEKSIQINKDLKIKINNPDLDYMDTINWSRMSAYYKKLQEYLTTNE